MKLKQKKITPEIKLYYTDQEPDWDLVIKTSQLFDSNIKALKRKPCHKVYLFEHNNDVFYAKKFAINNLEKRLRDRFHETKAIKCLKISNQLITTNFKVIEPIFVLNYKKNLRHESLFITKKYDGISINDFLINETDNSKKKEVMFCLISTLGVLFRNGFIHHDPILANFFLDKNKNPYEIIFLDLDSITYSQTISKKSTFLALSRFFFFYYKFLLRQNNVISYSHEQILYYLDIFLKSYNPKIKIDSAYKYLIQGTVKLLKSKKERKKDNKAFLSIIKDSKAC